MKRSSTFFRLISAPFIALVLAMLSCATDPVTGSRQFMLVSEQEEITIGRQTDREIAATYGMYGDEPLSNYVDRIGQTMAKKSHRPNLAFTFKILDTPVVNAFAVPGGYVYLTRGIMSYLNDEAELACVIGHEIGHVTARHSAEQLTKAQFAQLGLSLGSILSQEFRALAGVAEFGVGMLFMKFSRDNEREADDLGVEYATKAGYDADRMADFFMTLERLHPSSDRSGLEGWFSTHPNPPDRIKVVRMRAKEWADKEGGRKLEVNRDEYLRQIDGLVFGEDPRQGYVDDSVFYHPQLKFQFPVPAGWKIKNTPAQVQMFSPNQDAAVLFSLTRGDSPEDAAKQFVAGANAGVIQADSTTLNGLRATRVLSDVATQQGVLRLLSYFIEKDRNIYTFHGFSSKSRFGSYESVFRHTMTQFKPLTDQRRTEVQPARLRIHKIQEPKSLRKTLETLGVPTKDLEDMAVLNGMRLEDTLPADTLVKVVERGSPA